ncbi:linker histone H1 and H5 family protein [Nitzschia inconspicua]|uniref:Linker histone H1 and H5 family protein n=1 Tax=Nitzschia inconspicua TaxID=303405 RepID=A0A9K3LRR3_9STRA|nr:linker histone H1 and H5 family protein [Nitzschia inconspicua]
MASLSVAVADDDERMAESPPTAVETNDDDDEEEDEDEPNQDEQTEDDDDDDSEEAAETPAKSPSSAQKKAPSKNPSSAASTKSSSKSPSSSSIPFTQLVQDAIINMKDRTGSSQIAIQKWILGNHPEIDPQKLKQRLLVTLKNGLKTKRLIKVKASYKINPGFQKKKTEKTKKKKAAKVAAEKKKIVSKVDLAAIKEKERKEKAEKLRQERIRKRKFPMDDLKLIEEDKELKIVKKLPARPTLDLAMPHFPSACRTDSTKSGLLDDVLLVYHFFRGDLGWGRLPGQKAVVAPFTLEQWMQCVEQVMKGWAKKARMLPPLMTHLFVVSLQYLVPAKLQSALTPASWSEVLLLYMDAMERYYTTDASKEPNTIASLGIDTSYLFYASDKPKEEAALEGPDPLAPYLSGIRQKAHSKLEMQDPWTLSAEELLSLLTALVDDVLASSMECSDDLDVRNDEIYELLKTKRAADSNLRKLQTARNKELADEKKDRKSNGEAELATRSNVKMTKISEAKLEKARREQQKATDAYEKYSRGKRIRTEPIGMDRNFHEVYHSWNDPERVFVLQRNKTIPPTESFAVPDSTVYRMTWHSIDKKSTLDKYIESLDVRGKRESGLHDALMPVRKLVHDDIKEMNEKKSKLKEKMDLQNKLEMARKSYETGRKSGRLAAQSEQELIDLQNEIDQMEESIANGNVTAEYDIEAATGLNMLREFDNEEKSNRRASRRETQKKQKEEEEASVEKIRCSQLWPTGAIDGSGMVGTIVEQLLKLEERMECLVSLESGDRTSWRLGLEKAVESWNEGTIPNLAVDSTNSSAVMSPDGSAKSGAPKSSSASSWQILSMIKTPLLELESRIFEVSGLKMAAKDADDADDNMSTSPEDEEEQIKDAWKKIIHRLKRLPAKASSKIRTGVIDAIAAARKAHNTEVVAQLRLALVDYHPDAAGACKSAALEVLAAHGDYNDQDDEDEEVEEDDDMQDDLTDDKLENKESGISSVLCAEAVILNSSLDGQEDAGRNDWITAVKRTKTISKMAALVSAFVAKASDVLEKIEGESIALQDALEAWDKSNSLRKKKSLNSVRDPSEVWANVKFSDDFCLVKVENFPWWPARKCAPKDENLASRLEAADRVLVALIGESGSLRLVKTQNIVPFSETLPEDENLTNHTREIRNQLEDCMAMARRIVRGKKKKNGSSKKAC